MPVQTCQSVEKIKACLPAGFTHVAIASLTDKTDLKQKYIQAKVVTKYNLNNYCLTSIKFILESDNGNCTNLNAYGSIASELDINCTVGDTLLITDFEVDVCPKNKKSNGTYQIILDDQKNIKPVVWVIKYSGEGTSTSLSPSVETRTRSGKSKQKANEQVSTIVEVIQNSDEGSSSSLSPSSKARTKGKCRQKVSEQVSTVLEKTTKKNEVKKNNYSYTLLKDIVAGTSICVYGVVNFVKAVRKTSGSDYHMMMSIVDPSLSQGGDKLSCNLFHNDQDKLPLQARCGDVIRFHRLKVLFYLDKNQGRSGPGFHWVLFQGCYDKRYASSTNYTLEKTDKEKVDELLKWWEDMSMLFSQDNDLLMIQDDSQPNSPQTPQQSSSKSSSSSFLPSASINLNELTPIKSMPVIYKTLKEVQPNEVVSFYGVVIFTKPVSRTTRSDYYLMMNITDSSLETKDAKLTLNLFDARKDNLPHNAQAGDVIRFQHIKITTYRGKKQGMKEHILSWVLFAQSFSNWTSSDLNPVVKDEEKVKVQSLFKWWQDGPNAIPFSEVVNKQYFCLVCQVLAEAHIQDKGLLLLKAWDGTKFTGAMSKVEVAGMDEYEVGMKTATALDLVHDIFIFDNHVATALHIRPGDFIKLTNIHAAVVSEKVEMTLHGGTAYQRGVKKLNPSDSAVIELKSVLDPLIANSFQSSPRGPDKDYDGPSTSKSPHTPKLQSTSKNANSSKALSSRKTSLSLQKVSKDADGVSSGKKSSSKTGDKNTALTSSVRKRLYDDESDFEVESNSKKLLHSPRRVSHDHVPNVPSSSSQLQKISSNSPARDHRDREINGHSELLFKTPGGNYGFSTPSHKRHSDAVSDFELTSKKKPLLPGRNSHKVSSECDSDDLIIISDTSSSTLSYTFTDSDKRDVNSKASYPDSLNMSCISTPSSSFNLSERDRYVVTVIMEKDKERDLIDTIGGNGREMEDENNENRNAMGGKDNITAATETEIENSCISRNFSEEVWLSAYDDTSSTDVTQSDKTQLKEKTIFRHDPNYNHIPEMGHSVKKISESLRSGMSRNSTSKYSNASTVPCTVQKVLERKQTNSNSDSEGKEKSDNLKTSENECGSTSKILSEPRHQRLDGSQDSNVGVRRSRRLRNYSKSSKMIEQSNAAGRHFQRKTCCKELDGTEKTENICHPATFDSFTNDKSASSMSSILRNFRATVTRSLARHRQPLESSVTTDVTTSTTTTNIHPPPPSSTSHAQGNILSCNVPRNTSISPRKYLSLRSASDKSDQLSLSSTSKNNPVSCQSASSSSVAKALVSADNSECKDGPGTCTVSSSGESRLSSVPNDRQLTDIGDDEEQISSSTDTVSSKDGNSAVFSGERLVTVCPHHSHRNVFKLEMFKTNTSPTKCKVHVRLCDYFPRTGNVTDLVQFCCFSCKYIVPSAKLKNELSRHNPHIHQNCPNGCGEIQPHIVMKMILSDNDHDVKAILWRENAVNFFQGVTATDLLLQESARVRVQKFLDFLCPSNTKLEHKPVMECCILSYIVNNKMHFQIFDTVITYT